MTLIPLDDRVKFILTILLMAMTAWWAHYTVEVVRGALDGPTAGGVMQAAGASGLLATLATLLTLSWQFWFRRGKPSGTDTK